MDLIQASILRNETPMAVLDPDGAIVVASAGLARAFGVAQAEMVGRQLVELSGILTFRNWDRAVAELHAAPPLRSNIWLPMPDGTATQMHFTLDAVHDDAGCVQGYVLLGANLSGYLEYEKLSGHRAHQDPLTGLYDRRFLEAAMDDLIELRDREGGEFGLLVLDLDNFKRINDGYGHSAGDDALRFVSDALVEAVPLGDVIARIGGDEFVVVIDNLESRQQLVQICDDIRNAVSYPLPIGDETVRLSVSIGASIYPGQGGALKDLIDNADKAMFLSKRSGRNRLTFADVGAPAQVITSPGLAIIEALQHDPAALNFVPYYQKIVDLRSGRGSWAEALCRGILADGRVLAPETFIGDAESSGVISQIDRSVFEKLCHDMRRWQDRGLPPRQFSFNVSVATVSDLDFTRFVKKTLDTYRLDAGTFCIELTESMALLASDPGRDGLRRLDQIGIPLALDDFGTGASSLTLLRDLPISRLKIDLSFVRDILTSPRDRHIVESILGLCEALEIETVAEGVESKAQADLLRAMGVNFGQGYYFARPLPFQSYCDDVLRAAS